MKKKKLAFRAIPLRDLDAVVGGVRERFDVDVNLDTVTVGLGRLDTRGGLGGQVSGTCPNPSETDHGCTTSRDSHCASKCVSDCTSWCVPCG